MTSLYDGLYQACEEINSKAGRNDLKTVICLTDGRDSTPRGNKPISIKKPKEVIDYASKNKIRLVTVGLGKDVDVKLLSNFGTSTDGWFLQAKSASQLSKLYTSLSIRILLEQRKDCIDQQYSGVGGQNRGISEHSYNNEHTKYEIDDPDYSNDDNSDYIDHDNIGEEANLDEDYVDFEINALD